MKLDITSKLAVLAVLAAFVLGGCSLGRSVRTVEPHPGKNVVKVQADDFSANTMQTCANIMSGGVANYTVEHVTWMCVESEQAIKCTERECGGETGLACPMTVVAPAR